jgi:hypothetical protein
VDALTICPLHFRHTHVPLLAKDEGDLFVFERLTPLSIEEAKNLLVRLAIAANSSARMLLPEHRVLGFYLSPFIHMLCPCLLVQLGGH